jgi:hypothetical protein
VSTPPIPVLVVALVPYLALALVDGWMHDRERRVPRPEQWLHGAILVSVGTFIAAAFLGSTLIAAVALTCAVPVLVADEMGFHGSIARRERIVHYLADLALASFAVLWSITAFT